MNISKITVMFAVHPRLPLQVKLLLADGNDIITSYVLFYINPLSSIVHIYIQRENVI